MRRAWSYEGETQGDWRGCCEIVPGPGEPRGGRGRRSGMTRHPGCKAAAMVAGCLLMISGCTGGAVQPAVHQDVAVQSGLVRLTSFHGCGEELVALREAAEASVGPYGLPGLASSANGTAYPAAAAGVPPAAAGAGAAAPAPAPPLGAAPPPGPADSRPKDYWGGRGEPALAQTTGPPTATLATG